MRFSEFKKYIKQPTFMHTGRLLMNLEDLETYHPVGDKRKVLVKDKRSHQKDGVWCIYPIAVSKHQVHIVCPYCGEVHSHGRAGGTRVPHCLDNDEPDYNIIFFEHEEKGNR